MKPQKRTQSNNNRRMIFKKTTTTTVSKPVVTETVSTVVTTKTVTKDTGKGAYDDMIDQYAPPAAESKIPQITKNRSENSSKSPHRGDSIHSRDRQESKIPHFGGGGVVKNDIAPNPKSQNSDGSQPITPRSDIVRRPRAVRSPKFQTNENQEETTKEVEDKSKSRQRALSTNQRFQAFNEDDYGRDYFHAQRPFIDSMTSTKAKEMENLNLLPKIKVQTQEINQDVLDLMQSEKTPDEKLQQLPGAEDNFKFPNRYTVNGKQTTVITQQKTQTIVQNQATSDSNESNDFINLVRQQKQMQQQDTKVKKRKTNEKTPSPTHGKQDSSRTPSGGSKKTTSQKSTISEQKLGVQQMPSYLEHQKAMENQRQSKQAQDDDTDPFQIADATKFQGSPQNLNRDQDGPQSFTDISNRIKRVKSEQPKKANDDDGKKEDDELDQVPHETESSQHKQGQPNKLQKQIIFSPSMSSDSEKKRISKKASMLYPTNYDTPKELDEHHDPLNIRFSKLKDDDDVGEEDDEDGRYASKQRKVYYENNEIDSKINLTRTDKNTENSSSTQQHLKLPKLNFQNLNIKNVNMTNYHASSQDSGQDINKISKNEINQNQVSQVQSMQHKVTTPSIESFEKINRSLTKLSSPGTQSQPNLNNLTHSFVADGDRFGDGELMQASQAKQQQQIANQNMKEGNLLDKLFVIKVENEDDEQYTASITIAENRKKARQTCNFGQIGEKSSSIASKGKKSSSQIEKDINLVDSLDKSNSMKIDQMAVLETEGNLLTQAGDKDDELLMALESSRKFLVGDKEIEEVQTQIKLPYLGHVKKEEGKKENTMKMNLLAGIKNKVQQTKSLLERRSNIGQANTKKRVSVFNTIKPGDKDFQLDQDVDDNSVSNSSISGAHTKKNSYLSGGMSKNQSNKKSNKSQIDLKSDYRHRRYGLNKDEAEEYQQLLKMWQESLPCCKALFQNLGIHCLIAPTFLRGIFCFTFISIMLAFFGFLILIAAKENASFEVFDYSEQCLGQEIPGICEITIIPPVSIKQGHIYYQLSDFYSNHKNFVLPADNYALLRGEQISNEKMTCNGVETIKDLNRTDYSAMQRYAPEGVMISELDEGQDLVPCGLLSKFIFTDSIELFSADEPTINLINSTDIAHDIDKDYRFKKNEDISYVIDPTNEHFMVWHQMDSLSDVMRLYGRVEKDLLKNLQYTLRINDTFLIQLQLMLPDFGRWNTSDVNSTRFYNGTKSIIIQEVNSLGGTNAFLGWFIITGAVLAFMIQLIFLFLYIKRVNGNPDAYNPAKLSY